MKIVPFVILVFILIIFVMSVTIMILEDTKTFKAIDEKIADLIRGKKVKD